jgi:hypothetical protein
MQLALDTGNCREIGRSDIGRRQKEVFRDLY